MSREILLLKRQYLNRPSFSSDFNLLIHLKASTIECTTERGKKYEKTRERGGRKKTKFEHGGGDAKFILVCRIRPEHKTTEGRRMTYLPFSLSGFKIRSTSRKSSHAGEP